MNQGIELVTLQTIRAKIRLFTGVHTSKDVLGMTHTFVYIISMYKVQHNVVEMAIINIM